MLKIFLWLRYLRKKKIVFLSIAAVALSVALLVVVDSLFTGLIDGMKKSLVTETGHAIIHSRGRAVPRYNIFLDKLEELDGVQAAAPIGYGGGLLWIQRGDVREVAVRGIDPRRDSKFTDWSKKLLRQKGRSGSVDFTVPGRPDANGCWLGINIAAEPNEDTDEYDLAKVGELIGKQVVLTTQGMGLKRKVIPLNIADIAFTETIWGDQTLFIPLKDFQKIQYDIDGDLHAKTIKIKLADKVTPESVEPAIMKIWADFARDELGWDNENISNMVFVAQTEHSYFNELRKQKATLLLIFGVICSVTVLLIFCIFYMIVETRQKDIAIIKSCGASKTSAAMIFTGFGGCVGVAGSAIGMAMGYIVITNINAIEQWVRMALGLKLWRRSSYILNAIPNQINWLSAWTIVLIAIVCCCLGALIPAVVAAKQQPVEILRYE